MKVLHVINKQRVDGPGLRNLERSKSEKDVFFSGYWDMSLTEAQSLVGGMLFLHEAKSNPSRFGGKVLSVELVERDEHARANRVVFKIQAMLEGRGQSWRGASHAMAWNGGVVEEKDG